MCVHRDSRQVYGSRQHISSLYTQTIPHIVPFLRAKAPLPLVHVNTKFIHSLIYQKDRSQILQLVSIFSIQQHTHVTSWHTNPKLMAYAHQYLVHLVYSNSFCLFQLSCKNTIYANIIMFCLMAKSPENHYVCCQFVSIM